MVQYRHENITTVGQYGSEDMAPFARWLLTTMRRGRDLVYYGNFLLQLRRTCDILRSRGRSLDLPFYSSNTHKKSFILRTLNDFM